MKIGDELTPSCNTCTWSRWHQRQQILACAHPQAEWDGAEISYHLVRAKDLIFEGTPNERPQCGPGGKWHELKEKQP